MFGRRKEKRSESAMSTKWLINQSKTLLEQGKVEEALPLCQELVSVDPQNYNAWMLLSAACYQLKRYTECLDASEHALSINSQRAEAWQNKGLALVYLKRYGEALEAAHHIPLTKPQYRSDFFWICINIYSALHQYEELLAAVNYWIEHVPMDYERWCWLGNELRTLQRYDAALAAFDESIRLNPLNSSAWLGKGNTLRRLKEFEAALLVSNELEKLKSDAEAIQLRAMVFCATQRYKEAIDLYVGLIQRPNLHATVYSNYGYALTLAGRLGNAARQLARAIAMQAEIPAALNNLGTLYSMTQQHERALAIHERLLAKNSQSLIGLISTGDDLIDLGRYDEAHARLTAAWTVQDMPTTVAPAALPAVLCSFHTRVGQFDEAMAASKDAFAADPDNAYAYRSFAELLLALGEPQKAVGVIEKAISREPYIASAWSLQARILRATGDEAGADEAERHSAELLARQRAELAEFEREFPEWANG